MLRRLSLSVLVVFTAACDAKPTDVPKAESSISADRNFSSIPRFVMNSGPIDFDSMDPAEANMIRSMLRDAEQRQIEREREDPRIARRTELNMRHPMRFGTAIRDFADGAVAVVIRNSASATPRLIVLSKSSTDVGYVLAVEALEWDEERVPEPSAKRVIRISADQQIKIDAGMSTETHKLNVRHQVTTERIMSDQIREAVRTSPVTELSGVGSVRIAR